MKKKSNSLKKLVKEGMNMLTPINEMMNQFGWEGVITIVIKEKVDYEKDKQYKYCLSTNLLIAFSANKSSYLTLMLTDCGYVMSLVNVKINVIRDISLLTGAISNIRDARRQQKSEHKSRIRLNDWYFIFDFRF